MRWFRTENGLVARQLGREDLEVTDSEGGTWNPVVESSVNFSGTFNIQGPRWYRNGKTVFATWKNCTGISVGSTSQSSVVVSTEGLPFVNNATQFYGGGYISPGGQAVALVIVDNSLSTTDIFMALRAAATGTVSTWTFFCTYYVDDN